MNNCKYITVFLFALLLLTITQVTVPSATETTVEVEENSPTQTLNITQNDRWQTQASIWGDRVVWEDYRHDPYGAWSSPGLRNSCIYMYNITSGETVRLTHNDSSQVRPDIWENYVVWEDYRHGNADIYYMDLNTMTEHRVTTDSSDQRTPRIHNGRIVWTDYREHMFGDIYMYDISEEQEYVISDERHIKRNPDIYDDKIVWTDYRHYWSGEYEDMYADIYMYDLSLNEEIPFMVEPVHQHHPSIYGDTVAWIEYREGNNDIYMKHTGGDKTPVSNMASSEEDPRIYGGRIVYSERHYEEGQHTYDAIWVHDIASGENTMISKVEFQEDEQDGVVARNAVIYQDSIVWEERHLSQWENLTYQYDIFHTNLGNEPPVIISATVSTDSDEGNHAAEMTLKEGAYFTVTAEVIDPDGDLADVTLLMPEEELAMEEVEQNIFSITMDYQPEMVSGEQIIRVRAEDEEGEIANSDQMTLTFMESAPVISFVGVGTDMQNLTNNVTFTLKETNSLFFAADVTDIDSDLSTVVIIIEGFNLTQNEYPMTESETDRYVFELEYREEMTDGEKTARVIAEDARGNIAESDLLIIHAVEPTIENDENGILPTEGIFNWLFFLLLSLLILVIIAIIYFKRKEDSIPTESEEEVAPVIDADEFDKGICPNCIEVIPKMSEVCPHCGEELETPEE